MKQGSGQGSRLLAQSPDCVSAPLKTLEPELSLNGRNRYFNGFELGKAQRPVPACTARRGSSQGSKSGLREEMEPKEGRARHILARNARDEAVRADEVIVFRPSHGHSPLPSKDVVEKQISRLDPLGTPPSAGFLEQLCILSYLLHAKSLPLAGKLVRAEQLEAGQFFFRGHHRLPTDTLAQAFENRPGLLLKAAEAYGARPCTYGDSSIELLMLPRVPVTFIVWRGDEEFPARASILFDQTVSQQIPLDALLVGVNLAVNQMVSHPSIRSGIEDSPSDSTPA